MVTSVPVEVAVRNSEDVWTVSPFTHISLYWRDHRLDLGPKRAALILPNRHRQYHWLPHKFILSDPVQD